jgi:CheY-like chemotaxis protein
MPVMDGNTAIKALRNSESKLKDIPAVALTAANLSGEKEKCLSAGFDTFAG